MARQARIQLCGRLVVEIDERQVQDLMPGRQGRVLFGYLAAARGRAHGRAELIEVLWPGRAPASADSALSALLSGLRRALGDGLIEGRSQLMLRLPPDAWIDLEAAEEAVHRAEAAVARHDLPAAWGASQVALYAARRGFLPEADAPWADAWRRRVEEIHASALECYVECSIDIGGGELALGEKGARELVGLAPFRERGHLLLMRVLCARGNAVEALRAYESLRRLLRDELGATPGPELRAMQAHLLGAEPPARPGAAPS